MKTAFCTPAVFAKCRVAQEFLVRKDDLEEFWSSEAREMINAAEPGDDEGVVDDGDDPFSNGELVFDAGGRVHFTSDIPD
ncbi:hypothetical protein EYC08_19370 [Tabrizicola sp. WMC-M-20]|nr:hypothetical protein EYC08_19370 [Tabrizicola sp. WMC-M-20]